jgi:hypothetical protein
VRRLSRRRRQRDDSRNALHLRDAPWFTHWQLLMYRDGRRKDPQMSPRVAGQEFAYLKKRLAGYKTKTTSDLDGMMTMVAQSLSDEDVENLVHFMASVEPK